MQPEDQFSRGSAYQLEVWSVSVPLYVFSFLLNHNFISLSFLNRKLFRCYGSCRKYFKELPSGSSICTIEHSAIQFLGFYRPRILKWKSIVIFFCTEAQLVAGPPPPPQIETISGMVHIYPYPTLDSNLRLCKSRPQAPCPARETLISCYGVKVLVCFLYPVDCPFL